jgi:hypothetical protein
MYNEGKDVAQRLENGIFIVFCLQRWRGSTSLEAGFV